eukprot:CAMPEP_0116146028 /NCGR_PEP_ID=MMETSP0329-20121206/16938_1 /TAXON_ID=697910 /ORGANISM="Pseudo-nitzschia arenysensis, Strain B593" /LENGTH=323 /DNA_ID=CAMNT_0003641733 /DNA_START=177 /DNA_END=1148 /DNA_ORIENTATION=-
MFDAWQAQQKAQKDQERKAKTEAAAALQGYRKSGLSEEETKLAALREQERLQKLNAEQQLRGYRSTLTEEETKLAAQKQEEIRKKQEYEEQLRNNGVVSGGNNSNGLVGNSGVVSALAAGYTSPNKVQPLMPNESPTISMSAPDVVTPEEENPVASEAPEEAVEPDSTPEVTPPETETPPVEPLVATPTETAPVPPAPVSPTRLLYKSAVKFMFGILIPAGSGTSFPQDRSKLVEGYLARADDIAKSVVADNSSFESISLSMAYPTASSVKKDESRIDTNRIMVTVTISFTAPDKETSTNFKAQVINRVRSAIAEGNFTKIVR